MSAPYASAMKIDLSKYLTERYRKSLTEQDFEGPVITIARDFGCPSQKIATRLTEVLSQVKSKKKIAWRWINKEILYESAKELKLDPSEIEYVFNFEKKNIFDDILSSQSRKYYKSDRQIRKTIAGVIRGIASEGNAIIVGRGGVAVTRDIEKSLHIMLEAPVEWRTLRIAEKYCMTEKEARKLASEIDKKRREFREYFHGKGTDYTFFDVKYNCMTLSIDDIVNSIVNLLKARKFI